MEKYYSENRKKRNYTKVIAFFDTGVSYSLDKLKNKINEAEKELKGKDNVDIWIDASCYEEEGKYYLKATWADSETKDDFEKRILCDEPAKRRSVETLRRLINDNKEEALNIIKELGLL